MRPDPPTLRPAVLLLLLLLLPLLLLLAPATAPAQAAAAGRADPPLPVPVPLARLEGPSGVAVAFSRDGRRILTAGKDGARVWDAQTFKPVTEPLRHAIPLFDAAYSPDQAKVLTVAGHEARVWDAETGRRLASVGRDEEDIWWSAFTPDGTKLVTSNWLEMGSRLWDVTSGGAELPGNRLMSRWPVNRLLPGGRFIAFSPDGSRFVALVVSCLVDDHLAGRLEVYDAATGREVSRHAVDHGLTYWRASERESRFCTPAFTPDGTAIATVARNGEVEIWDTESGRNRAVVRTGEHSAPAVLAFSPDGRLLLTTGADLRPGPARIWNVGTGRCVAELRGSTRAKNGVFSPDGRQVLTAGPGDGTALWDFATCTRVLSFKSSQAEGEEVPVIAFGPDGRRVAVGFAADGWTGVYAVPGGKGD